MSAYGNEYWLDPAAVDTRAPKHMAHLWTVLLIVLGIAFGLFLTFTTVDQVTKGVGRVIPSSQVQVIAHLEGGILKELMVRDGEEVKKGQVLARIGNSATVADFNELIERKQYLSARLARLRAEATQVSSVDQITFPDALYETAPQIIELEKSQFLSRRAKLNAEIQVLTEQLRQREQEYELTAGRAVNLRQQIAIAMQEMKILGDLAAKNAGSQGQYLAKQREVLELRAQLDGAELSLPANKAAIGEATNRLQAQKDGALTIVREEMAQTSDALNEVEQRLTAGQDRYVRTEVQSPVDGIVKDIRVYTIGGVLRPGQELMEVVPLDDTLLIEARVSPNNIGFLQKGLPARIRVSAYDFTKYGYIDAVVEDISADTMGDSRVALESEGVSGQAARELVSNPNGAGSGRAQPYYRIYLRTQKNYIDGDNGPLPIIPGMTVNADILTGEKSLLDYLLKPVLRATTSLEYAHVE